MIKTKHIALGFIVLLIISAAIYLLYLEKLSSDSYSKRYDYEEAMNILSYYSKCKTGEPKEEQCSKLTGEIKSARSKKIVLRLIEDDLFLMFHQGKGHGAVFIYKNGQWVCYNISKDRKLLYCE